MFAHVHTYTHAHIHHHELLCRIPTHTHKHLIFQMEPRSPGGLAGLMKDTLTGEALFLGSSSVDVA